MVLATNKLWLGAFYLFLLLTSVLFATPVVSRSLPDRSLVDLEARLQVVDEQLKNLPGYSLRSGTGSIGFRSILHRVAEASEWIEIELDQEYSVDEIILVPTLLRSTKSGPQADAFPIAFRVLAGSSGDKGEVIADFRESDFLLPRVAPLVIPAAGTAVSWVRIEVSQLSSLLSFPGFHTLQLAEICIFSNSENVALNQTVKTSSENPNTVRSWSKEFLVDGLTPYRMHSGKGNSSLAYISRAGAPRPNIIIDLEGESTLSQIHLHSTEQDDTVPQAYGGELGVPQHLRVLGSLNSDFSDSVTLLDFMRPHISASGPIIMRRIEPHDVRYVKISHVPTTEEDEMDDKRIGFSEIALISAGENVALGKPVRASPIPIKNDRGLQSITDGHNFYGEILPQDRWLKQLALRHELERERPSLVSELNLRYERQKQRMRVLTWLTSGVALTMVIVTLLLRNKSLRNTAHVRKRIAANLHDELGASLHAIGLLGDHAINVVDSRQELIETAQRIRTLTKRTSDATNHCSNMLYSNVISDDLVYEIKSESARLLEDVESSITFEGESHLKHLKQRRLIDLVLFNKECLTNIIRHSQATRVSISIIADRRSVVYTITDNGHGLLGMVPASLQRRAQLMRGTVSFSQGGEGTIIILTLNNSPFRWIPILHRYL